MISSTYVPLEVSRASSSQSLSYSHPKNHPVQRRLLSSPCPPCRLSSSSFCPPPTGQAAFVSDVPPRSASLTNPSHLYLQCDGGCRRATLCSSAWHPGSRMTYTWCACAPSVACGGLFVPTSPSSKDAILVEELELLNLNACQKISDKGIEASTSLCPNLLALSAYWIVGLTDASIGHIVKNCKQIMEFNLSGCKEAIFIA